jgi:small subunit ribosomal protein S6
MAEVNKHPNGVREYETVFLVKPDLTDENVDKIKDRVKSIVAREGGKFLRFTLWGKKKTMFPVAKQPRAIYVHAHFLGGSNLVAEIERNLRNIDEVTRFMSKRLAEHVDSSKFEPQDDLKLPPEVEDNKPFGGAERDSYGGYGEDGGYDDNDMN